MIADRNVVLKVAAEVCMDRFRGHIATAKHMRDNGNDKGAYEYEKIAHESQRCADEILERVTDLDPRFT